jgi:hypothetical protein
MPSRRRGWRAGVMGSMPGRRCVLCDGHREGGGQCHQPAGAGTITAVPVRVRRSPTRAGGADRGVEIRPLAPATAPASEDVNTIAGAREIAGARLRPIKAPTLTPRPGTASPLAPERPWNATWSRRSGIVRTFPDPFTPQRPPRSPARINDAASAWIARLTTMSECPYTAVSVQNRRGCRVPPRRTLSLAL